MNYETRRVFDPTIELKDNAMLKVRPDLFNEWDYKKNDELGLDVYRLSYGSGKRAWWIGLCGHEWNSVIRDRAANNNGCPYCCNKKTLMGFNDIATTHPELIHLLLNKEDGFKYSYGSTKKINWKCNKCGNIINKSPNEVTQRKLNCQSCSDGISLAEKVIFNLLKAKNLLFDKEIGFDWSLKKRYDFFLPELNTIIEVHGKQHYNGGFKSLGGNDLSFEQANDQMKHKLAIENGIAKYIVIDASETSLSTFKREIIKSEIANIVDLNQINWEEIFQASSKSVLIEVCIKWNNGERNFSNIAKEFGIAKCTVSDYLKRGADMNICTYTTEEATANSSLIPKRCVVQLSLANDYIAAYTSMAEAKQQNNFNSHSGISNCCSGRQKIAHGYRWMYLEDYDSAIMQ